MNRPATIEWLFGAGKGWNPITGCGSVPASRGCENCWARRAAHTRLRKHPRYSGRDVADDLTQDPSDPFAVRVHEDLFDAPLHWQKPLLIFTCGMGDFFHECIQNSVRLELFKVMARCPQHIFIILTKRARLLAFYAETLPQLVEPYCRCRDNVIFGVSVEDQDTAAARLGHLWLAHLHGWTTMVSYEPALGPVDWRASWYLGDHVPDKCGLCGATDHVANACPKRFAFDWLICGGEIGERAWRSDAEGHGGYVQGARPMHPDWPRAARDFAVAQRIPFFFKHWGEWRPREGTASGPHVHEGLDALAASQVSDGCWVQPPPVRGFKRVPDGEANLFEWSLNPNVKTWRVGRKAAGRELDGKAWNEAPVKVRNLVCRHQTWVGGGSRHGRREAEVARVGL